MVFLTLCWILTGVSFMTTVGFLIDASLHYGKKDDVKAANTIRIAIAISLLVLPIWFAYFARNSSANIYLKIAGLLITYLLGWIFIGGKLNACIKLLANDKLARWCSIIDTTLSILIIIAFLFSIFGPVIMIITIFVAFLIWFVVGCFKAAIKRRNRIS